MPQHHFVPQFLLREWLDRGELNSFCWLDRTSKVIRGRVPAGKACSIENLNAFFNKSDTPETQFFTPSIDTPAAIAHKKILRSGVRSLSEKERDDWARFIVAFPVRTPEVLQTLGRVEFRKNVEAAFANPTDDVRAESIARAIVDREMPRLEHDTPINVAIDLASDESKHMAVKDMFWWTRHFRDGEIFIGDRPLLSTPRANWPCGFPLDDSDALIGLPISHNTVFFASPNRKNKLTMAFLRSTQIAFRVNTSTIERANKWIYALNLKHNTFIESRFAARQMPQSAA